MSATVTRINSNLANNSEETISRWHRFHRWTKWKDEVINVKFRNTTQTYLKDIQTRRCVKCNRKQERYLD